MRKKKKRLHPFFKIVLSILLILSIFLSYSIIHLNVLTTKYLVLILGVIILLFGTCTFLTVKRKNKVIGFSLSTVLIITFSVLNFYLNKTNDFLGSLDIDYKTYNYSVVVLKTSNYKKLKDLNGKTIGYYDDGSEESQESLAKISKNIELEPISYEDTHELAKSLLDEEEEAILIENSYLDILNENIIAGTEPFKDKIKKIYSFTVVTKTSDISKDINVTEKPFNVYLSGIDTYGEISSVSRSDVNMIATVNPETRQILLTSIPRDYYVRLHGKSGYRDKLTHAGLYGTDMSIQTIEDLLDIEINYYVKVNFSSVIDIVNAIGGVEVYSDYSFTSIDNYKYTKGYNEVNGEEALSFARERKAFALGDRQRIKNQQALLTAIFEKCTSKSIITKYTKLLDSLSGSFVTNMKMSRFTSLIKMQLAENYSWNLVTNSLTGTDASNYTYSAPSQKAYVMEPIEENVEYASDLIQKVLAGESLQQESVNDNAPTSSGTKVTTTTTIEDDSTVDKDEAKENNDTASTSTSSTTTQLGLKTKLVRSSVEFTEGEEYIYYGYTATYDDEKIASTDLEEKFSINGQSFDNYYDLISYVSKLASGNYTIIYTIKYQQETNILNQIVTIVPDTTTDTDLSTDEEDTITNENANTTNNNTSTNENSDSNDKISNKKEDR